ncbi:hypothetical protein [Serratia sp. (in: enterobacteria)]|uniref:hypothetical protein n=1 Tax=Serratia sp. (in: enterobacteria) TaxID=616 RepID=UPI0039894A8F
MKVQEAKFSSKEFLKRRRPERFSDSTIREIGTLDRVVLEHFLSTLNTRNQELQFEDFAKKICEKVICPNLLEQTGPVAGGDGKTDTQTFPVSEQSKLLWFEGINETSNKERWAFAVSTRKDWKKKCYEDVLKIKETGRGYTKIFCVTNQSAKSNIRSEVEDKLKEQVEVDVRVLDINWILDQIYKNHLEHLAIETLSIPTQYKREVVFGENDYKKQNKYEELSGYIKDNANPTEITYEQVDMFLEIAELSAELEKSVFETQGLFERAIKIAMKFGTNQQLLDAYYQYAWKSHFWLEDFNLFEENLQLAYDCILSSTNSAKWEKILNLVTVHKSYIKYNSETPSIDIENIERNMLSKLDDIAEDESRPSNALTAKTHKVIYALTTFSNVEDASAVFDELHEIIKNSENLIGYPFEKNFHLLNELDDIFFEVDSYENLLDYMTEQSALRDGEVKGALLNLRRGIKRIQNGHHYQAIKHLGKSLLPLYKEESRDKLILALKAIAYAYESIGLLWSSRSCLLLSASLITDNYWKYDEISLKQVEIYYHLCLVEIKLGKLAHALLWYELFLIINHNISDGSFGDKENQQIDLYISKLILNTNLKEIERQCNIPDELDRLGIFVSSGCLKYALGYIEDFEREYEVTADSDHNDFLQKIRDFDAGFDSKGILDNHEKRGIYKSFIFGCVIEISFPNRSPFIEFSTNVLSLLESAFATCEIDNIHLKEAFLLIEIIADDEDGLSLSHEINSDQAKLNLIINCSGFDTSFFRIDDQQKITEEFKKIVFNLLPELFFIKKTNYVEKMIFEDSAFERAISFGSCIKAIENILGNDIDQQIKKLYSHSDEKKTYSLLRNKSWDNEFPKVLEADGASDPVFGKGRMPEEKLSAEDVTHKDYSIQSLIKPRLWDRTRWKGVGFAQFKSCYPGLYLLFKDASAGEDIFKDLMSSVGLSDSKSRLRVCIVKGISVKNPAHYRVLISENMKNTPMTKRMTMISRINTMTPDNNVNLDRFLAAYHSCGKFYLGCDAMLKCITTDFPRKDSLGIEMSALDVRWAWEIGLNDVDCIGVNLDDDDPYIPDGVVDAPLLELINSK